MLQADASTVEQFQLPVAFSFLAYFTFAVTGALAAARRGYDIVGVLFLALITASGGGLIRDGILISSGPPTIVTDSHLLLVILAGALTARFIHPHVERFTRIVAVIDAIGLGAFAVHGVQCSLAGGLSVPGAILGGTLTTVGGGLLRDILVREEPLFLKPGQFYAVAAIGGCCLFLGLVKGDWFSPKDSALITIVVVFAFRMLTIRFNWKTTAVWNPPAPSPPSAT